MITRRILGIDPGSRITGFGIIEQSANATPICLLGGCVRLGSGDMFHRLGKLFLEIQEIVQTFKPTELAIEQIFVHKSAQSALKLGQARGVAIAAGVAGNLLVYEYAPRQIKQAIVGSGSADKSQIQHMIQILLSLNDKPQADAADALAVALCHLHSVAGIAQLTGKVPGRRRHSKRSPAWISYDRTNSRNLN